MIKQLVQSLLRACGYAVTRIGKNDRRSLCGVLSQVQKNWQPDVVVDVGAAFGTWSLECVNIFSQARYILVEPLTVYRPRLETLTARHPGFTYVPLAANAQKGQSQFHVHADLVGSSLKKEVEGEEVDGETIVVPCDTIDTICAGVHGENVLIKIDVQGAELDVLRGAETLLSKTQCVILEVSLFRSFHGGSDWHDMTVYMKQHGFVLYDLASFLYRPFDGALSQVDAVFVREDGLFRTFHGYATPEQRQQQNKKFIAEQSVFIP